MSIGILDTATATYLGRAGVSLFSVFIFLIGLVFLDSYKLVRLRHLAAAIAMGALAALGSLAVNTVVFSHWPAFEFYHSRFGAPLIEELLKGACIFGLLATARIGFMVDGAIFGFAVGTGFAFVENVYYLQVLQAANPVVWVLRGLGTAAMHGGTTAIVGIVASSLASRARWGKAKAMLPGLAIAFAIHSFYNLSLLGAAGSALLVIVGIPSLMTLIFLRSEKSLEKWLNEGLDADLDLLTTIAAGHFRESNAGWYLDALKRRFPVEVVADMFCLLQVTAELSARAKAELMAREAGFKTAHDPEVDRKFDEMKFLYASIGPTGKLAVSPLLAGSSRDIWQLRLLR